MRKNSSRGTITLPELEEDFDVFDPIVNHYVRKDAITESIVFGTPLIAMCGESWVQTYTEDGGTAASSGVLCPLCADVYAGMPAK